MTWNWQQKDWPNFIYEPKALKEFEVDFMHRAGVLQGSIKHISADDKQTLTVNLISEEAFKTSEIEGELLNRDSLQSSIRKHFGLKTDNRSVSPAEQGVSEMLLDLYNSTDSNLTHAQLFKWHEMLTNGRRDLQNIGAYRAHSEPMQIVSGGITNPTVHYEALPSERIQKEMDMFVSWFNETRQGSGQELSALTRSGIAHIYFESIHPFEDGNGRIGRAISEKALSESLGGPTLIAIAQTIEKKRKGYYAALHACSVDLEINEWLHYFCNIVLEAQDYTQSMIDFLIEKGKFYERFGEKLNTRQSKVIERMFKEGVEGFKGGLSADNYIRITDAARATVTRDLQNLVEKGALIKTGELKYTRYYLNIEKPR
jgi:Fic family protein